MIDLSHAPFFIVGAGLRQKFICTAQGIFSMATQEFVAELQTATLTIDAPAYTVTLESGPGTALRVSEDEKGVWLTRGGHTECLAEAPVHLPTFDHHPHRDRLRVLHHEILTSIVGGAPVPNLLVYQKPWYRDSAMVCMVLEKTGNIECVRDWILSLHDPYDRNNAGDEEPDNLGQVLYLLSLVSDRSHPLVAQVLEEAEKRSQQGHLVGKTDFSEHPVYQTKWLKFGLQRLGLPDPYSVPPVEDSYASLFWWDKEGISTDSAQNRHSKAYKYPYLAWASAHYFGDPPPLALSAEPYPITWEAHASQAEYSGMEVVDSTLAERRMSMPHTWHAAEMFLYLYEDSRKPE